jgi:hypothetical protein
MLFTSSYVQCPFSRLFASEADTIGALDDSAAGQDETTSEIDSSSKYQGKMKNSQLQFIHNRM